MTIRSLSWIAIVGAVGCGTSGGALPAALTPVPARVVIWGVDGVYVSDADGDTFTQLTAATVYGVNPGGGVITTFTDAEVTRYDPDTGAVLDSVVFDCPDGAPLSSAVTFDGVLYGVCDVGQDTGPVWRAEADGSTVDTGAWASGLVVDQGTLYAVASYGIQGNAVTPLDPATLGAAADELWTGIRMGLHGDVVFWNTGEVGKSAGGGGWVTSWSDPTTGWGFELDDGVYVEGMDVLPDGPVLVNSWNHGAWLSGGLLLDQDGDLIDDVGDCQDPHLVARAADVLEGWCKVDGALTRLRWTLGTKDPVERVDMGLAIGTIRVLEEGD